MSDERPIVNVQTSATQIALEAGGHTEVTTLTADGQVTLQAVSQEVTVPLVAERAADVALHHPTERVALEMPQGASVEVELQMGGGYSTPPDATEWGHIEGTLADQEDLDAALDAKADASALGAHVSNTMNPHSVTKNQIGLWHVDNTSDADKPVSNATQTALDGKVPAARAVTGGGLATGGGALTEDREISVPVATQAEAEAGEDNTTAMTPLRVAQAIAELAPGSSGYTNWGDIDGAISSQMDLMGALGEKVNTADLGGAAWAEVWDFDAVGTAAAVAEGLSIHGSNTSNPHSVTKEQVGLGNADNTSDAAKPVSDATQTALDGKLSLTGGTVVGDIYVSDSFTVDGRDLSVDGTKLDGIESGADVTDATNVEAAGAVMESDTTTAAMSFVVDEDDMVSDSAFKLPTQQSVKAYVDSGLSGKQASGSYVTALTGDVTASGPGSVAATIANDAVTNAKAADMAESTLKGRAAGAGTGDPTDLTATQATAILNEMVGDAGSGVTKGLVPAAATGNATTHFLRKDGTWAAPGGSGTGDVVGPATNTDNYVPLWDGADSKTLKDGLEIGSGGSGTDGGAVVLYGSSGKLEATQLDIFGNGVNSATYGRSGYSMEHASSGFTQQISRQTTLTADTLIRWPDASGTVALLETQAVKAWVNFDGTANSNQAATYARTGTTVTVSLTAHDYIVGHVVQIDFTSGGALDGLYTIATVPNANSFTVTTAASGTIAAGSTLNLLRRTIRDSFGVHSVTAASGTGVNYINFRTAQPSDDYAVTCNASSIGAIRYAIPHIIAPTTNYFVIHTYTSTPANSTATYVMATVSGN